MQSRGLMPWRRRKTLLPEFFDWAFNTDDLTNFFDEFDFKPFKVDLRETEKEYVIEADLPGCDKDNIKISYEGDILTINANYEEATEEKDKNFIRRERRQGNFSRSIPIPDNVKSDAIKANFNNGVLRVILPKLEISKPSGKIIDIE
ncbi:Hsp20/alpha crystallin family protein [Tepidanaerobacter sp. EBM-38]|uniref:Hsp20/alpha crystallin family protein n=1 Tax=Tepidanaerobacter sp. EBM-38 TaxID=1918496 RepID=UPI000B07578A|nr:Hsp20/alpha crystallin family protein [Tepidanaerobacter sp. EBM-38]